MSSVFYRRNFVNSVLKDRIRWPLALLAPYFLLGFEGYLPSQTPLKPWFTGPILSASGNITEFGHWNVQPYFSTIARTGFYQNNWKSKPIETLWNLQFRIPAWIGFAPRCDFRISPVWNWNRRKNQTEWTLSDWTAQLNIQLLRDELPSTSWLPSAKISIRQTFPLGKYKNLNPKKLGTDSNGLGSWTTAVSLNTSKLFHIQGLHYLNLYLDFLYAIPTSVHVKGFNAYGGGYGTLGTINPAKSFQIFFAFEYSLTQNWAFACDAVGIWNSKIGFSGMTGIDPADDQNIDPLGLPAVIDRLPSIQYSLAPAIEYSWNENIGIVAGAWFTVAGKNISSFSSGIISFNYYH